MSVDKLRVSRALIVVLAFSLVLGALLTMQRMRQSQPVANHTPTQPQPQPQSKIVEAKPIDTSHDALVTQTPSANPGAQPGVATPATQPAIRIASQNSDAWPMLLASGGGANATVTSATVPATQPVQPVTRAAARTGITMASITPVVTTAATGNLINDGRAKLEAGDLLGSRKMLNDALVTGQLNDADATAAKQLMSQINDSLVFTAKRYNDDALTSAYAVQPGELMLRIAAKFDSTADFLCRINGIADARKLRAGQTIKIVKGPFHAVVSKSKFTLDLYLGSAGGKDSTFVKTFMVGLGKESSTPTGTWMVEPKKKLKNPTYYSPRGEGVIAAGDPKNPLGAFWIGLEGTDGSAIGKASYGIHGTIEPDSIGKEASLGCIRMRNEDVAVVFEMMIEGKSTVVVRD